MTDQIEYAREHIEHAGHHGEGDARRIAVLIAALAAGLAITEMAEKAAQNAYLSHHIQASDDWAFFQAKTIRANMYALHAELLDSLPPSPDAARKAEAARATVARHNDDEKAGDGRKQMMEKARASEALRDEAFHRYHLFETVVGALQISIVLASVSVVTRVRMLAYAAGAMGVAAGAFAGLVAAHLL